MWELTHALVNKGHEVTVICEKVHKNPDDKINVVELGVIKPKPRWLSQLKFSKRVTDFFEALALVKIRLSIVMKELRYTM